MAKGKLILICKCGGEFVTHETGYMSYVGGEFSAENVNYETQFDDLKLNLAKRFYLDQRTMSIKYFLPGNKGFLIPVKSNKDVKRMIDFHGDALTAEVFVTGVTSFYHLAFQTQGNREGDIKRDIDNIKDGRHNGPPNCVPCNDSATPRSQATVENKGSELKRKRGQSDQELDLFHRNDSEFVHLSSLAINDDDLSPENLVSTWKSAITGVGQEFKDIYVFRDALQKHAFANRFVYKFNKNNTTGAVGGCAAEGCSWKFHIVWVPPTQTFKIKSLNKEHTCDTESSQSQNWLLSTIKERLQDSPHLKPKEIANRLLWDFVAELYDTQIWLGIASQPYESHQDSYNKLPWFCEKITEMNPGSILKLVVGEKKRFKSLFVSFNATIYGFQNSRPVIFLEATCLKSKYGEVLLTANAINGNDGFFQVAFGIVDVEDDNSWGWFIQQLKAANLNSKPITFVFDKEKNLKKTIVEVFEDAHVGYSIFHLLEAFKRNMRGQLDVDEESILPFHLLSAAHAARPVYFIKVMDVIKWLSPQCYSWVMQIEPEYWASSSFKGEHYNYITKNVGESYFKLMEDLRELPILQKIDALIHMMIDNINNANLELSMWSTHLTPAKEKHLEEERIRSCGLKVLMSSDTLFEVRDDSVHSVNISNWSCTCFRWKETGLPCRHALAVFALIGKNPYEFCSRYFTVNTYQLTYSDSIKPVPIDGPFVSWPVVGNQEEEAKNIGENTRGGENRELEKVEGVKEEAGQEKGDKGKTREEHEDPNVYVLPPIPTKQPPLERKV